MDALTESQKGVSSMEDGGVAVKMEGQVGGDEDPCPIAQNAALLEELDAAEGKVAELLEVAADALDELAGVESLDSTKVEASTKKFLELVSSVHGTLSSKAELIRDYTPYPRSIYGPRKELELLHEKARFLRTTLAELSKEQPASSATKEPPEPESPPQDDGGGGGAAAAAAV
ncbi:unnamed protein product [Ectocarpus fasciculatus]